MPAVTGRTPGNGGHSLSFTIPREGMDVEAIYAAIDASAAAGDVTAELTIADQAGVVIATRKQSSVVKAGDTGSATWALRLADDASSAVPAGALLEVAYGQVTTDKVAPSSVVSTASFTVNTSAEVYLVNFFSPTVYAQASNQMQIHLKIGTTELGIVGADDIITITESQLPLFMSRRVTGLTPGTFTANVYTTVSGAGTFTVRGGDGTAGNLAPCYLQVLRVGS